MKLARALAAAVMVSAWLCAHAIFTINVNMSFQREKNAASGAQKFLPIRIRELERPISPSAFLVVLHQFQLACGVLPRGPLVDRSAYFHASVSLKLIACVFKSSLLLPVLVVFPGLRSFCVSAFLVSESCAARFRHRKAGVSSRLLRPELLIIFVLDCFRSDAGGMDSFRVRCLLLLKAVQAFTAAALQAAWLQTCLKHALKAA